MLSLAFVATLIGLSLAASPTQDRFFIRCIPSCQVYFDGANVGSSVNLNRFDAPLSLTAQVVAVDVDNTGTPPGGFLASSNKALFSDTTWKCSRTNPPGWNQPNFDDSQWSNATFYQYNRPQPKSFTQFPQYDDIDDLAQWVGAGYALTRGHMYCRKKIPLVLSYYCDNYCRVWVDGVVGTSVRWPLRQKMVIPDDARVLAFWLDNSWDGPSCVVAGTNRGMFSDNTFRCTNQNATNWWLPNYDDSAWPAATLYGAPGWQDIDPSAQYTSTPAWDNHDVNRYIFCRKRLQ